MSKQQLMRECDLEHTRLSNMAESAAIRAEVAKDYDHPLSNMWIEKLALYNSMAEEVLKYKESL